MPLLQRILGIVADHADDVVALTTDERVLSDRVLAVEEFPSESFVDQRDPVLRRLCRDKSPARHEVRPRANSDVKWTKLADGSGRESADLFGDRSKNEIFGYLVRWPPHTKALAHSHPDTRYAIVLSGTFFHGYGMRFDTSKLERRDVNAFFTESANVAHFGETRDQPTILYFVGIGPDRSVPLEK